MSKQIAAIEFGTSKIVTVIAKYAGPNRLDIAGAGTVPYDGYQDGDWNTPEQMLERVHDSIAAAELEAGLQIREIYVGVPGEYIRVLSAVAEVDMPNGVVDDDAVNAVEDEAADQLNLSDCGCLVMHRMYSWFEVDGGERFVDVRKDVRGKRLKALVTFIIADPTYIEDVSEMIGRQGITILGFLSTSLGEVLTATTYKQRDDTAVVIDVGYLSTEISVCEGDAIIYHAMLPMGGADITVNLVYNLRISRMEEAERIKRSYEFDSEIADEREQVVIQERHGRTRGILRRDIQRSVENSLDELADMIRQTLEEDVDPLLGSQASYHLTGGGIARMRGAREALARRLGRGIIMVPVKSDKLSSPAYTTTLGLACLIFDCLEEPAGEEPKFTERVADFFTGMFRH